MLSVVRLSGALFFDVDVSSPWSARSPPAGDLVNVLPGARHLMSYHLVIEGEVWAVVGDQPPARVPAGAMIVFPHGDPHMVGSDPALGEGELIDTHRLPLDLRPPYLIRGGGSGGGKARMVCGFFGCDARPFNPLLRSLPASILVDAMDRDAGDLGVFFRMAVAEANAKGPGAAAMLERLGELMLIEALRRYMRTLSVTDSNWLSGIADPQLGEAIRAVHAAPGRRWTLRDLARRAGMSRSAFAARFAAVLGVTPMGYVSGWRMQLAASCLANGGAIALAAGKAGYDSEAAFSRAFKKTTGQSPGRWRETAQTPHRPEWGGAAEPKISQAPPPHRIALRRRPC